MSESSTASGGETSEFVVDGLGNVWRHYNDIGYARLLIEPGSGRELAQIVQETGVVRALTIAHHVDLLRARFDPISAPVLSVPDPTQGAQK